MGEHSVLGKAPHTYLSPEAHKDKQSGTADIKWVGSSEWRKCRKEEAHIALSWETGRVYTTMGPK